MGVVDDQVNEIIGLELQVRIRCLPLRNVVLEAGDFGDLVAVRDAVGGMESRCFGRRAFLSASVGLSWLMAPRPARVRHMHYAQCLCLQHS